MTGIPATAMIIHHVRPKPRAPVRALIARVILRHGHGASFFTNFYVAVAFQVDTGQGLFSAKLGSPLTRPEPLRKITLYRGF